MIKPHSRNEWLMQANSVRGINEQYNQREVVHSKTAMSQAHPDTMTLTQAAASLKVDCDETYHARATTKEKKGSFATSSFTSRSNDNYSSIIFSESGRKKVMKKLKAGAIAGTSNRKKNKQNLGQFLKPVLHQ